MEREFQILTLMNFHEPLEIKCDFQRPSSSDSPLLMAVSVSYFQFLLLNEVYLIEPHFYLYNYFVQENFFLTCPRV